MFLKPPPEAKEPPDTFWELRKTTYGLGDAPRQWFLELQKTVEATGVTQSRHDPCIWYYYVKEAAGKKVLKGMLAAHVDDLLPGGDGIFHRDVMDKIDKRYTVGKKFEPPFTYCGIHMSKDETGAVCLDQEEYAKQIESFPIPRNRSHDHAASLTPSGVTTLRRKLGELMWLAGNTRPDLACETSYLSSRVTNGTIADLHRAWRLVNRAQNERCRLRYFKISSDVKGLAIWAYSDSSFGNLTPETAQTSICIFIGTKETKEGFASVMLLDFGSNKTRRVARSTFTAETLSAATCLDKARFLQILIQEAFFASHDENWMVQTAICTDCNSLFENVVTLNPSTQEKILLMEIASLKEALEQGVVNEYRWVPTHLQYADSLTKDMDQELPLTALTRGTIRVRPTLQERTSAKAVVRNWKLTDPDGKDREKSAMVCSYDRNNLYHLEQQITEIPAFFAIGA